MIPIHAAAGIPVRDGKMLLGLRASHRKSFADCWDVIGGHVEDGETPEEAFLRELREEIGITPTGYKSFGAWIVDGPGSSNFELTVFCVDAWIGALRTANDEHAKIEWFDVETACVLPNLASGRYPDLFRSLDV